MKTFQSQALLIIAVIVVASAIAGCGRDSQSPKVTAEQLQQGFEKADPSIKQEVAQATSALQSGDYAQAVITLNRVTPAQVGDEAQKKVMATLIQQTRQAVQRDPKLNSPELYKAMSEMVLKVHGEN